jgi:hypothetical protein
VRYIVSRYIDNSSNRGWFLSQQSNTLFFTMFNTSGSVTLTHPTAVSTGQWTHMTGVFTGSEIHLYVNGLLVQSGALSSTTKNTTAPLVIGGRDGSTYSYPGLIDDVRIYNYPLSADQVKQVMNEGASVRYGN